MFHVRYGAAEGDDGAGGGECGVAVDAVVDIKLRIYSRRILWLSCLPSLPTSSSIV